MRTIAFATAAALLLAACGAEQQENTDQPEAEPVAASNELAANEPETAGAAADELQPVDNSARPSPPTGGGDMSWNFSRNAAGPRIAYGVPQTDNVRLMLRCTEGGDALLSFIRPSDVAEDRPDTLSIVSGSARRSLTIETQQGPLGTSVLAQAPLSSAPLQQFRSGSELEVRWGDETIAVPGAPDGPVRQFFDACT